MNTKRAPRAPSQTCRDMFVEAGLFLFCFLAPHACLSQVRDLLRRILLFSCCFFELPNFKHIVKKMRKMKGIEKCAKFVVLTLSSAQGLPTACREDDHCPSGSYCSAQLVCHACLSCEDFKREPPPSSVPCISFIAECGSCLAGFVSDHRDAHCVQKLLLPYEWTIIGVSLMLAVVICALAVYVLRNFQTFKILATTRTSAAVASYTPPAPAADLPPSYNAVAALLPINQREEAKPFIEAVRQEPAERQDACVYNNSIYTQPVPQNSVYTPMLQEVLPPIPEDDRNISESLSARLEDGGRNDPPAGQTTAVKLLPAQQDSNNNSEPSDEESGEKAAPQQTVFGHSGTAFIINVIRNVNSVQQRNDLMV